MNNYLYHVTLFNRLPEIGNRGIISGQKSFVGASSYDPHREGRIFATSPEGISFWFERAGIWANHYSDDLLGDMAAPVVLRFPHGEGWEIDELGTHDANEDAFLAEGPITEGIEVFHDGEWIPVEYWADLPIETAFDTDDEWPQILASDENPFYPSWAELDSPTENPAEDWPDSCRAGDHVADEDDFVLWEGMEDEDGSDLEIAQCQICGSHFARRV